MKLKKFRKNNKRNTIVIISLVLILGLVVSTNSIKSYASFKTTKEFNVIRGKIPNKIGDVKLAVMVDGVSQKEFPIKNGGYVFSGYECTNGAQVEWLNDRWAPIVLNLTTSNTSCKIKFEKSIYNSITVNGTVTNEFPARGDYQVSMGCTNVTSSSWDYTNWVPVINGQNQNTSCNVIFKSTSSIITKITKDGVTVSSYPTKGSVGKKRVVCTGGGTGSWDDENWKPMINDVTNATSCVVDFLSCSHQVSGKRYVICSGKNSDLGYGYVETNKYVCEGIYKTLSFTYSSLGLVRKVENGNTIFSEDVSGGTSIEKKCLNKDRGYETVASEGSGGNCICDFYT